MHFRPWREMTFTPAPNIPRRPNTSGNAAAMIASLTTTLSNTNHRGTQEPQQHDQHPPGPGRRPANSIAAASFNFHLQSFAPARGHPVSPDGTAAITTAESFPTAVACTTVDSFACEILRSPTKRAIRLPLTANNIEEFISLIASPAQREALDKTIAPCLARALRARAAASRSDTLPLMATTKNIAVLRSQGKAARLRYSLDRDFSEYEANPEEFQRKFLTEVSAALQLPSSAFRVEAARAGSIQLIIVVSVSLATLLLIGIITLTTWFKRRNRNVIDRPADDPWESESETPQGPDCLNVRAGGAVYLVDFDGIVAPDAQYEG